MFTSSTCVFAWILASLVSLCERVLFMSVSKHTHFGLIRFERNVNQLVGGKLVNFGRENSFVIVGEEDGRLFGE